MSPPFFFSSQAAVGRCPPCAQVARAPAHGREQQAGNDEDEKARIKNGGRPVIKSQSFQSKVIPQFSKMMLKIGTNASTGPSTKDSASGGRKTNAAVAGNPTHEGLTDAPVLVGVSGDGTAVTFSDDVQVFSSPEYVTEWSEEEGLSADEWSSEEEETESEDEGEFVDLEILQLRDSRLMPKFFEKDIQD